MKRRSTISSIEIMNSVRFINSVTLFSFVNQIIKIEIDDSKVIGPLNFGTSSQTNKHIHTLQIQTHTQFTVIDTVPFDFSFK